MKVRCSYHLFDERMKADGEPDNACAASPDCLKEFELADDEHPNTFLCEPICPPCHQHTRELLKDLKAKGVTVTANFAEGK